MTTCFVFGLIAITRALILYSTKQFRRRYCSASRQKPTRTTSPVDSSHTSTDDNVGIGTSIVTINEGVPNAVKHTELLDFSRVPSMSPQSECVTIDGDQTLNESMSVREVIETQPGIVCRQRETNWRSPACLDSCCIEILFVGTCFIASFLFQSSLISPSKKLLC